MNDTVRSGLCHGPDCDRRIVPSSPSEDFCSERCAARWNGRWDVTAERVWQVQQYRESGVVWSVSPDGPLFQFTDSSPELFERTYLQWAFQERSEPMPPMLASLKQRGMLRTVEPRLDCGCPDDSRARAGCLTCDHTRCLDHRRQPHDCGGAEEQHESALTRSWWRRLLGWLR